MTAGGSSALRCTALRRVSQCMWVCVCVCAKMGKSNQYFQLLHGLSVLLLPFLFLSLLSPFPPCVHSASLFWARLCETSVAERRQVESSDVSLNWFLSTPMQHSKAFSPFFSPLSLNSAAAANNKRQFHPNCVSGHRWSLSSCGLFSLLRLCVYWAIIQK